MEARSPETASARRRRARRDDTRRTILDATEALLVEDGFEAFSMRRLVERCGYTAPTIYHYFGDKLGLVDELLDERVCQLLARLRRVPRGDDPEQNLRALFEDFVSWGLQNPAHYTILTGPRPADSPESASVTELREIFEAPLRQIDEAGGLVTSDMEEAKQALWVLLHGLISMHTSRPEHPWCENLVQTALEAMLRGLLKTTGRVNGSARARGRNGS